MRERIGDIPLLAAHFLRKFGTPRGVSGIEADAMQALIAYSWRGNIRELENVIVSAVIQAKPGTVRVEHLKAKLAGKQMLRAGLVCRLEQNRGDMDEAALYFGRKKELGLSAADSAATNSTSVRRRTADCPRTGRPSP